MSTSKDTIIRITGKNNYTYSGSIGKFIDNIIDNNKDKLIKIGEDSVVMDLEDDYNIIGVSNDEKTSWKKISQISRHPANGGLVKVFTKSGKTTIATLSHSFLKRTEKGIDPILGSDLKIGDRIPVSKYIAEVENSLKTYEIGEYGDVILDKDFGWLCGTYIADGNITYNNIKITKCIPEYYNKIIEIIKYKFNKEITQRKSERSNFPGYDKKYIGIENNFNCKYLSTFFSTNFGNGSENKKIPAWVYGANKQFISGIIQGYFDGDGNINGDTHKCMIRAGSISEQLINDMIVLLSYFGIFGSKCLEVSKTGKIQKPFHTIQISRKYAPLFKEEIGLVVESKIQNLDKIISYINREDKRCDQEMIDKVPMIADLLIQTGKYVKHNKYQYTKNQESIGRLTLQKYIKQIEDKNKEIKSKDAIPGIELLKQAAYSDVVWDEIINLEYLDDPKEYVYDFTVPGNDSFMVDTCILVHNTLNTSNWRG
jgi:DNA-directed RNA polymerase subunit A"